MRAVSCWFSFSLCLVLSTPLWAEEPSDLAEDNGFAIGRTLSDYYSGEAKERFIRGLLAGLQNSEDTASIAEPSAWFDAPERTRQERASYAAGYLSAETYASPEMPYSMFNYLQGFADSAQNAGPGLEIERLSKVVNDYQRAEFYKLKRQVAERMQDNDRAGRAFLKANARNSDVTEMPSGLQYRVLEAGAGDPPGLEDAVVATLIGRKIDGAVFYDSASDGSGKPVTVQVRQTLKGWQEALTSMSPGATWEIFMPATLAYGNAGWQNRVEPGETLIYEIRLIEVIGSD
jgi:FKBP-type peptidyl-prolyl cis-trans isomerase FklB